MKEGKDTIKYFIFLVITALFPSVEWTPIIHHFISYFFVFIICILLSLYKSKRPATDARSHK